MRAPDRRQRRDTLSFFLSLSLACVFFPRTSLLYTIPRYDRCASARPAEELRRKYKYNHLLQSATPPVSSPGVTMHGISHRLARTIVPRQKIRPLPHRPEANPREFQASL